MPLSFEKDIKPLFREEDVDVMMSISDLDLWKYENVRTDAQNIYERLADESMPCDEPWPQEQIIRFKQWIDEGMAV